MKFLIFFLLSLISGSLLAKGGVNGGGSDHLPHGYGAAWFLDGKPARTIKVCFMQDAEKFPISESEVLQAFEVAFSTWKQYIIEKNVNEVDQGDDEDVDPVLFHLLTNYEVLKECGKEDLAVYLGYTNKEIEEVRSTYFDPFAFTHRVSYDFEKSWGKGFIWLKGLSDGKFIWNKNQGLNLQGIFLHELGHVFGNEHRDGTVMEKTFSKQLMEDEIYPGGLAWDLYKYYMTSINWTEELVQCLTCVLTHEGGTLWLPKSRAEKETFRFLTGRDPVGDVTSKLELKEISSQKITGI